jgi:hypothetical protein
MLAVEPGFAMVVLLWRNVRAVVQFRQAARRGAGTPPANGLARHRVHPLGIEVAMRREFHEVWAGQIGRQWWAHQGSNLGPAD